MNGNYVKGSVLDSGDTTDFFQYMVNKCNDCCIFFLLSIKTLVSHDDFNGP